MSSLAPSAIRRSRRAAASFLTSARMSLAAAAEIFRTPGSRSAHSLSTRDLAPAGAKDVGKVRADARRSDREQLDANRLGQVVMLDLGPQFVEVEQPLGDQEGRNHLLQGRAFLFGQVEGDARAEPVDEPVGDLGRDNLVTQPVGADRVGVGLAHRLGKGIEQLRPTSLSSDSCSSSAASCSTSLDIDSTTASSGRVRPRFSWPRASVLRSSRGLRPCGRAGRRLRAARPFGHGPAAPARRPLRRSTAPASAGGCPRARCSATSSVIFASKLLRCSNVSRPSRISRLSGILMFTSLSEQSTPALLSMKSVLMRPPCSANSIRPACVIARLAPSPMTLARSSRASARSASLDGSITGPPAVSGVGR